MRYLFAVVLGAVLGGVGSEMIARRLERRHLRRQRGVMFALNRRAFEDEVNRLEVEALGAAWTSLRSERDRAFGLDVVASPCVPDLFGDCLTEGHDHD